MLQLIEEPTRGENTLDLLFTNEIGNITEVEVNKSAIPDQNRIEVDTGHKIKRGKATTEQSENRWRDEISKLS